MYVHAYLKKPIISESDSCQQDPFFYGCPYFGHRKFLHKSQSDDRKTLHSPGAYLILYIVVVFIKFTYFAKSFTGDILVVFL